MKKEVDISYEVYYQLDAVHCCLENDTLRSFLFSIFLDGLFLHLDSILVAYCH